jgi:type II secretory pathway pseudopilin PulG
MKPTGCRAREAGLALLEVMIAALVVGISAIGVALLLNSGRTFIVAQGDNRVALYLAEQGIEQQVAQGFPGSSVAPLSETVGLGGTQTFTRVSCVNFVLDTDPTQPPGCPGDCALGVGTCTQNTVRITVTVTPALAQAQPVTLQTVIVKQ